MQARGHAFWKVEPICAPLAPLLSSLDSLASAYINHSCLLSDTLPFLTSSPLLKHQLCLHIHLTFNSWCCLFTGAECSDWMRCGGSTPLPCSGCGTVHLLLCFQVQDVHSDHRPHWQPSCQPSTLHLWLWGMLCTGTEVHIYMCMVILHWLETVLNTWRVIYVVCIFVLVVNQSCHFCDNMS